MKKKIFVLLAVILPGFAFADDSQYQILTNNNDSAVIKQLYTGQEVIGNTKNPTVIITDFFDNNCKDCKAMAFVLKRLVKENPGVEVIFKEYPILGPDSQTAAVAALAAAKQRKYLPMHDKMMAMSNHIGLAEVKQIAQEIALDYKKLEADFNDAGIYSQLSQINELADKLNIQAVPAIYITNAKMLSAGNHQSKQYQWFGEPDLARLSALVKKVQAE